MAITIRIIFKYYASRLPALNFAFIGQYHQFVRGDSSNIKIDCAKQQLKLGALQIEFQIASAVVGWAGGAPALADNACPMQASVQRCRGRSRSNLICYDLIY